MWLFPSLGGLRDELSTAVGQVYTRALAALNMRNGMTLSPIARVTAAPKPAKSASGTSDVSHIERY
jgi:hypothetical protein